MAGGNLISGNNNTFLGYDTVVSNSLQIYNDSTAVGIGAIIDASNQIVLGRSSEKVYIPGSYVGIGVFNPLSGYKLEVSGSALAASWNIPSDYRIKENVKILDETFTIDHLRPVNYKNIQSGKQDIGAIRNLIKYVYFNASAPDKRVKYVNLFGDASFDFKNREKAIILYISNT